MVSYYVILKHIADYLVLSYIFQGTKGETLKGTLGVK